MSQSAPRRKKSPFAAIPDAIAAIGRGEMVIVVDDEDRENEGDLTLAADKVTPGAINFMAKHGRGQICLSMTGARLDELDIPLAVNANTTTFGTAFCVPIDLKGPGTGISAADRAATVLAAIKPETKPSDLARPGHVSPLRSRDGGVMVRCEPLTDPVLHATCPSLDSGHGGPARPAPEAAQQQMHDCVAHIGEKYQVLIDALYGGKSEQFVQTQVKFEDGRTGSVSATLPIVVVPAHSARSSQAMVSRPPSPSSTTSSLL